MNHKTVEKNVGSGELGTAKRSRIVVHTDHNVITPDIKTAVLKVIIFLVAFKIFLKLFKVIFHPGIIPGIIRNQADLAAQERLVHVHEHAFLVLHVQIRLRPVLHFDHHRNVAVGKLMVQKILDISSGVDENLFLKGRLKRIHHAKKAVYRPVGVPVPDIAVVDRTGINKGIVDKAAGLF